LEQITAIDKLAASTVSLEKCKDGMYHAGSEQVAFSKHAFPLWSVVGIFLVYSFTNNHYSRIYFLFIFLNMMLIIVRVSILTFVTTFVDTSRHTNDF